MRYIVHSPCAFHNWNAKLFGRLTMVALVALLLPTAADAQTPAKPVVGIAAVDDDSCWGRRGRRASQHARHGVG